MVMLLQKDKYKYGFSFYQWIKMILGATYMDVSKPKTTPQPANSTEKSRQLGSSYRINKLS
jgi:hypothetical protein